MEMVRRVGDVDYVTVVGSKRDSSLGLYCMYVLDYGRVVFHHGGRLRLV